MWTRPLLLPNFDEALESPDWSKSEEAENVRVCLSTGNATQVTVRNGIRVGIRCSLVQWVDGKPRLRLCKFVLLACTKTVSPWRWQLWLIGTDHDYARRKWKSSLESNLIAGWERFFTSAADC